MSDDPRETGEWNDDAAAWMEAFAKEHGVVAALDHLHLTALANYVGRREAVVNAARSHVETASPGSHHMLRQRLLALDSQEEGS